MFLCSHGLSYQVYKFLKSPNIVILSTKKDESISHCWVAVGFSRPYVCVLIFFALCSCYFFVLLFVFPDMADNTKGILYESSVIQNYQRNTRKLR